MSGSEQRQNMNMAEYRQWEILQKVRHEFWNGVVYSREESTRKHSLVAANLLAAVGALLKGQACEAHGSGMRVFIRAAGSQAYPDMSVVCAPINGDSEYEISNPTLVAEVLSPSTEDFDRGTKFGHYRTMDSLQEYLVLWQDQAKMEQHTRTPEGFWLLREIEGISQSISLESLGGAKIQLADIYDKVELIS